MGFELRPSDFGVTGEEETLEEGGPWVRHKRQ